MGRLWQRGAWRRLTMGLATLLGPTRRGFFVPHRHAAGVRPIGYPALEPWFAASEAAFIQTLAAIDGFAAELRAMTGPAPRPRLDQAWFPRLDLAAAYALIRHQRPARIIEIGSGHSTRLLAAAVQDQGLPTRITCIDPAPRAALAGLPVEWQRSILQNVPLDHFATLQPGDVLFVDSSHVLMPGSDVDLIIGQILPTLPAGVLVHFHDVFLPDPYPESWAWRGYNEQAAIAALLQGGGYRIRFASHYIASRLGQWVEQGVLADLPDRWAAFESSLWLDKTDQRSPPVVAGRATT